MQCRSRLWVDQGFQPALQEAFWQISSICSKTDVNSQVVISQKALEWLESSSIGEMYKQTYALPLPASADLSHCSDADKVPADMKRKLEPTSCRPLPHSWQSGALPMPEGSSSQSITQKTLSSKCHC